MSYTSERGSGVAQYNVNETDAFQFLNKLGASGVGTNFLLNDNFTLDGNKYKLKNTKLGTYSYNLYDLIAIAKAANIDNQKIADALVATIGKNNRGVARYTPELISKLNQSTTPAAKQISEYLNKNYPDLDAQVSVLMDPNGVDYIHRITYTDPSTGETQTVTLTNPASNNKYDPQELSDNLTGFNSLANNALASAQATSNVKANAQAQLNLANEALNKLTNSNLGSNAQTNRTITSSDIAAVKAALPGTNDLQAWNLANKYGVHNIVSGNITPTKDEYALIDRASLSELQDSAANINAENQSINLRNINNQRKQLLQQIQRDPELYEAIVSQFRSDAATGVTAGQRAANAAALAKEKNTEYNTAANELYQSLISGDNSLTASTRQNAMSNATTALDAFVKGKINNMNKAGLDATTQSTDVATAVEALMTALDVDASRYENAAAEKQAAADANTSKRVNDILADVNAQTASQDAALQQLYDTYGIGKDYLQSASSGSANVNDALQTIIDAIQNPASSSSSFKKVDTPAYENAKQFTNKEYNDVVNNSAYKSYLDNMDSLTKTKSLNELLNDFDLDMLSEEGMKALYNQYAEDANKQSNQIFNAAQRAYIAAITAGDAATTASLERLAQTAGISRGNLYAASDFANQYQRQSNALSSGNQMNTDALNQISENNSALSQARLSANQALTNYIGNGTNSYDSGSLYGAAKLFDNAAAQNRQSFGQLGNKLMSTTQGMNTTNVNTAIGNADRLSQLANQYTSANATSAANNTQNAATRNTLIAEVEALRKQAERTLNK